MAADPLALGQAAAAALVDTRYLAAAQPDPDLPLSGYLVALPHFTAAVVSAASTASRLADIAVLTIFDPEDGARADTALKRAERSTHQAGDQASHTFDEIRRALRATGQGTPYPDGPFRVRRHKTTAEALALLATEAEKAVRASPPIDLRYVEGPAGDLAGILARLGAAGGKLHAGISDAYTQLPKNGRTRTSRATSHITQASRDLETASRHARQAAGIITDAIATQRKAATW